MKQTLVVVALLVAAGMVYGETDPDGWLTSSDPSVHFDAFGLQDFRPAPRWPGAVAAGACVGLGAYLVLDYGVLPAVATRKAGAARPARLNGDTTTAAIRGSLQGDKGKTGTGIVLIAVGIALGLLDLFVLPE